LGLLPKFKTRFLVGAKLASPCLFEPSERVEQALPIQKRKYSELRLFGQQAQFSGSLISRRHSREGGNPELTFTVDRQTVQASSFPRRRESRVLVTAMLAGLGVIPAKAGIQSSLLRLTGKQSKRRHSREGGNPERPAGR
jgi:hypothetical protein